MTVEISDEKKQGENHEEVRVLRTLKVENQRLEQELTRKDKILAEAAALLVLQIPAGHKKSSGRSLRQAQDRLGGRGRMTRHEGRQHVLAVANPDEFGHLPPS
ncbi:MAG: hypothetical protein Q8N96_07780 [Methylovulum sp.]|nr:hypothetical protein [Methylovulum sp.]